MSARAFFAAAIAALAMAFVASCDPVHADAVAALGDEAPGVRRGPLHRPGQPCLLCHDGTIGNPPAFSVAGTVFLKPAPDAEQPAANVEVTLTNVGDGTSHTTQTNAAGNFYLSPSEWTPVYPIAVTIQSGSAKACMTGHVGRDGSCAGCHVEPAGQASPGRVVLMPGKGDGVCPQ